MDDEFDIYDTVDWLSEEDSEDDKFGHLNFACPTCRPSEAIFVFDEDELNTHGFTCDEEKSKKSGYRYTSFGICIGDCAQDNEAVPDESHYVGTHNPNSIYNLDDNDNTIASELTYLNLTDDELKEKSTQTSFKVIREQFQYRYRIKSLYRSALNERRYSKLSPPYFVGRRVFMRNATKEQIQGATPGNSKQDWFENLVGSLKMLEFALQDNLVEKNETAKRLAFGLVCTYLHKSTKWVNIEPYWSFMKRMEVGNRQILKGMNDWPPLPAIQENQIKLLNQHQPDIESVETLVMMISSAVPDVRISDKEEKDLIKESQRIMKLLMNRKIGSPQVSLADELNNMAKFNPKIAIHGNVFPALGLVEALCVQHAAKTCLDSSKARVLDKKYLFPQGNGNPWWIRELSNGGLRVINKFPYLMRSLSK